MNKSTVAFIHKWGYNVQHTALMKPIVHPVYKKKLVLNNPTSQLQETLEVWFNGGEDIIVEIDGNNFAQQDFQYITQLNEIIKDNGEIGEFELGNLKIKINSLNEYQNDLIKI